MLTDAEIREILTSREISHSAMGRRYGRSHEAIRQIRYGISYTDRCSDVTRWIPGASCEKCQHWAGSSCDLGLVDPLIEGVKFAQDCSVYKEAA